VAARGTSSDPHTKKNTSAVTAADAAVRPGVPDVRRVFARETSQKRTEVVVRSMLQCVQSYPSRRGQKITGKRFSSTHLSDQDEDNNGETLIVTLKERERLPHPQRKKLTSANFPTQRKDSINGTEMYTLIFLDNELYILIFNKF
jgi:hypothetical protein